MGFLDGKKALILGLANDRSIAFGIAEAMHRQGAELALTYPTDKLKRRVEKFGANWDAKILLPCDVSSDEQITTLFTELKNHWDGIDILVHSIAFATLDQLEGDYVDCVTREGFKVAHDISSYSFAALAKAAMPMMEGRNGAMITISYLGAERVMPNYNVMGVAKASLEANMRYMASSLGPRGIRVNAISAGPIRTLSASAISGIRDMLAVSEKITPLRKNVTVEQVGNAAAFLCSDLASGITGDTLYVDAGFHVIGMPVVMETASTE